MDFVSAFEELEKGNFIYESNLSLHRYYFMEDKKVYVVNLEPRNEPKCIVDFNDINADVLFKLQLLLNPEKDYEVIIPKTVLFVPPSDFLDNYDLKEQNKYLDHYKNIILNNGYKFEMVFCSRYDIEGIKSLELIIQRLATCDAIYLTKDWNKSSDTVLLNLIAEKYGIDRIFEH